MEENPTKKKSWQAEKKNSTEAHEFMNHLWTTRLFKVSRHTKVSPIFLVAHIHKCIHGNLTSCLFTVIEYTFSKRFILFKWSLMLHQLIKT